MRRLTTLGIQDTEMDLLRTGNPSACGVRIRGMGMRQMLKRPLPPGARVRVLVDPVFGGPFQTPCFGTVESSERAQGLTPTAARKSKFVYLVVFDTPQFDVDGDGPYAVSQVLGQYIKPA